MLSNEGQKFLDDTQGYLRTKGIRETDIISFIEDAELHLIEGEKKGKTVSDIFGHASQEYANQLAEEMDIDRKGNYKLLLYFIVNLLAFTMMKSVFFSEFNHRLSYSLIELIGYPIMIFVGITVLIWGMRTASFKRKRTEFLIMYISGAIWFLLIFSIALLNKFYGTTFIKFTSTESLILVGVVVLLAVVINIKFGGWFTLSYLLVPIVLEYVFVIIDVSNIIGMYVQQIILFIVIYMLLKIHIKLEKREVYE
ncbi:MULTISPECIES: DUF1129 domain-containing protein [unclassified Bacillus cereus group]|uniref:DUF1129 domain-containing protein n=1 Tax=unclassified Bacillus cereus group TaxID=2750818 RepID=UPI001F598DB2|nr:MULTISPECIES: DUF1129 domain-containing protein [unclassified Bacillus cereus group]MDA1676528.1 DUF1129 domain-containing protein [Bacillus cereus group sp. TH152-1LC]